MRSPVAGFVLIALSVGCNAVSTPTGPSLVAASAEFSGEAGAATLSARSSTVPIKGRLEGVADPPEPDPPPSTSFSAHLAATVNATHLGRLTMDYSHRVEGLNGSGSAIFTAPNGDSFTTTVEGTATPTSSPTAFIVVETHTITATGGVGRFADLRGSFVVTRTVDFLDPFTAGSIEGMLIKQ